mmetsp:Transcript_17198/g.47092  ORF Transcript_17198/g.47092 Transcript_17198/m.47092 type:complete len:118 (-) Transcript_17198:395-748(-)|eukprot:CAMPEP_0168744312 /NCGR_PEP_ID=MMETSP0724-20121128/14027_1 /TAXON_ID=265536 /ORGANISM="Amphiprora sp., Strain CCMP467" /LENGTH=117 /DNA_ID=CAMNT_0008791969 /DNA_START=44 /DNA_END=397 /DNA_ORIENTATION=-
MIRSLRKQTMSHAAFSAKHNSNDDDKNRASATSRLYESGPLEEQHEDDDDDDLDTSRDTAVHPLDCDLRYRPDLKLKILQVAMEEEERQLRKQRRSLQNLVRRSSKPTTPVSSALRE